jgi:hypothetical protein
MSSPAEAIRNAVQFVTKDWAKQRKAEERNRNAIYHRRFRLMRSERVTLREAAFEVMEEAYFKASGNGTLPTKPRQIMYAARPHILEITGERELSGSYFSQTLLIDYMEEYDCDHWDVIWDARGHFIEPHTETEIPLGTLEVRQSRRARVLRTIERPGQSRSSVSDKRCRTPVRQHPLYREGRLPPDPAGGPATGTLGRRAHEHERNVRDGVAQIARRAVAPRRAHLRPARL